MCGSNRFQVVFSVDENDVLIFDSMLVIVGGGVLDDALLHQLVSAGAGVVAADGGADACAAAGVTPDAIIGDMDSLDDIETWRGRTRMVEINEQNSTDFEKCLYSTKAPLTIAMGMTGKRLDHTLAALDAVARYAKERHILLVDETDVALGVSGGFSFDAAPRDRVSIHPLHSVRFEKSTGLKYPLDGIALAPGVQTGTSNEAVASHVEIMPAAGENGSWLLILDREKLSQFSNLLMQSVEER